MWMGTYPSVESRLAVDGTRLSDHLKAHRELLGNAFTRKYSTEVPFLPKVYYPFKKNTTSRKMLI